MQSRSRDPFQQEQGKDRSSLWLFTFASLFTALLAFFLFTTTKVEIESSDDRRSYQRVMTSLVEKVTLIKLQKQMNWLDVENTMTRGIRLTLNLNEQFLGPLFQSSRAQLNSNYLPFLEDLAQLIQDLELEQANQQYRSMLAPLLRRGAEVKFLVRIEGHTDATPMQARGLFANNIELSTFRAYAMMQYLRLYSRLPNEYFVISGYGGLRPKVPDNPNGVENRRVEIYIQPLIFTRAGAVAIKGL